MKTFLAVALYTAMVAAFDLGGAVWQSFRVAHAARVSATVPATAATSKPEGATRAAGTIPSDT